MAYGPKQSGVFINAPPELWEELKKVQAQISDGDVFQVKVGDRYKYGKPKQFSMPLLKNIEDSYSIIEPVLRTADIGSFDITMGKVVAVPFYQRDAEFSSEQEHVADSLAISLNAPEIYEIRSLLETKVMKAKLSRITPTFILSFVKYGTAEKYLEMFKDHFKGMKFLVDRLCYLDFSDRANNRVFYFDGDPVEDGYVPPARPIAVRVEPVEVVDLNDDKWNREQFNK
jgi:hypothetical protein